ncbi:RICIN domain-containing protein [Krasilnikovia sp. MM14-A1004]|uniref:RICIN domain-containing protein n=1 Tax=Krasilnikovia sp. MM14-A1004 TaxID=3373541 RepID=UPI00399C6D01
METDVQIRTRIRSVAAAALAATLSVVGFGGVPARAAYPTTGPWVIQTKMDDLHYNPSALHGQVPRCVEVAGATMRDGGQAQMYTCQLAQDKPTNQYWDFEFIDSDTVILHNEHSTKCLNVASASMVNGAKVIQYTCADLAMNERWDLTRMDQNYYGKDYYVLKNVHSGLCLNVASNSELDGADLIQYDSCKYPSGNSLFTWHRPTF